MSLAPSARPSHQAETVLTDGTHLAVRHTLASAPGLPPAVYVHGLGGSSHNWTDLAEALRGLVDGMAVDLPGFGASPPPAGGDYSIDAHTQAVAGLIEHLGAGPVHLFGNSMGGAVSTRLAATRPDLVRTLTLISPALPDLRPRPTVAPVALLALPGVAGLLTRQTADRPAEEHVRNFLRLAYADPARIPEERFLESVEGYRQRQALPYAQQALVQSARGLVREYLSRSPEQLWRQAARVQAPTLLVYGRHDKLVDPRMAHKAVGTFPDVRLLTLPDSGHVAMMEHTAEVAQAFRALLREMESAKAVA